MTKELQPVCKTCSILMAKAGGQWSGLNWVQKYGCNTCGRRTIVNRLGKHTLIPKS